LEEAGLTAWLMAFLSRVFDWRAALVVVKPDALIRWHRKGLRLFWRWKSGPVGRPRLPKDLHGLIDKVAAENPTWGEERIANEMKLKLGIRVSPRRVQRYLVAGGCPGRTLDPSQGWLTFVHNHAQAILASDFLVGVTARFRVLYVLVIMELGSRRRSGGGFCRHSRRKRHQLAGSTDEASGTWVRKMGKTSLGVLRMADPLLTGFLCQKTVMNWPYECWKTLSQGRS
jgi:hypothetical protein